MFTGIIQGQGQVLALQPQGEEVRLQIKALFALEQIQTGESIAVNGTCLTVESHAPRAFTAFASAETLARTSLGFLSPGSKVNLERALALGDRLGGHIVSGHVDCLAKVEKIVLVGASHRIRLTFPPHYQKEIIPKGSVTLDGISLTVNDCGSDFLEINAIPETWKSTTMRHWGQGTCVNLETDVIGKYVQRMLAPWLGISAQEAAQRPPAAPLPLTEAFLRENGF